MCGRYALAPRRTDAWLPVTEALGPEIAAALAALPARYNVCPGSDVTMILREPDTRALRVVAARWGYVPPRWREAQPPRFPSINARSEDAAFKPLWRDAWRRRRCLIPATHWYEWQPAARGKQAYAHAMADGVGFLFAGLWSRWQPPHVAERRYSCALLTRDSGQPPPAHPRVPLILHSAAWQPWLEPFDADPAWVAELLRSHAIATDACWPVSDAVNRPQNDGPQLLQPLGSG